MSQEERRWLIYVDAVNSVDEPVTVAVYDKAWPEQFAAEASRLKNELPHTAVALEHIGSTAVPGLAANYNVQVVEYASPTWNANLLFRDFLRSDPDAAKRYAEMKRAAATEAPTLLAYSRLKARTIEELLRQADAPK